MDPDEQQPGAGPGARAETGRGTGRGEGEGEGDGLWSRDPAGPLFDHEKLEVYRVARDFYALAAQLLKRKIPQDLRAQFDSASLSIVSNIGEGAGKTARADKQRSYEIARGSTLEAATQLDVLRIRETISEEQYALGRSLLLRIAQMLSRLCAAPRTT